MSSNDEKCFGASIGGICLVLVPSGKQCNFFVLEKAQVWSTSACLALPVVAALKLAINKGVYRWDPDRRVIFITYNMNGIISEATFGPFERADFFHLTSIFIKELHRVYDKSQDLVELAASQGVDLSEPVEVSPQLVQQAEVRRKNVSTVNPNVRAKKPIIKGFAK